MVVMQWRWAAAAPANQLNKAATEAATPTGMARKRALRQLRAAAPAQGGAKMQQIIRLMLILPGPINDQTGTLPTYAGLVACNETLGTKMHTGREENMLKCSTSD